MTITDEQCRTYAGIYVLKKMDLKPADGGVEMPVILPTIYSPLDAVLEHLVMLDYLAIDRKKQRYTITKAGYAYIGQLIDEAEAIIAEFDDWETEDMLAELERRNLDPLRVRFLWGWYQDEFDDLVLFQERRGVVPVEPEWPLYITSPSFYEEISRDLEVEADDEAE